MHINTIINSDCLTGLRQMPDCSVQCCITSPPYFGLRDYGMEGQIGLEDTPEAFIARLVEIFREVRRVLKDDGTLWVNIGDSYAGGGKIGRNDTAPEALARRAEKYGTGTGTGSAVGAHGQRKPVSGLKPKDLIGIPWMLAFALRADGWYLRQDIIWHKTTCMPESVKDRCTKSHEYIFLFSKSQRYHFDHEAIMEPLAASTARDSRLLKEAFTANRPERGTLGNPSLGSGMLKPSAKGNRKTFRGGGKYTQGQSFDNSVFVENDSVGNEPATSFLRNKRSVWSVAPAQFKDAHFATFPEDLIVDCIKAGCPENGIVLDPFMGAGTTALVAKKLNRNYVGFELNPDYITMAETRLQKHLGLFA